MRQTALDNEGFTLVEAVVAGVLSVLVLLTLVALYIMNMQQISGVSARSLSRVQYQTVIEQIGRTVRTASMIGTNQTDYAGTVASPYDTIFLFDTSGTVVGGYCRITTSLKEWNVAGAAFVPFKTGNNNVQVTNTGAQTTFTISSSRRSVQLNLSVFNVAGSTKDTFSSKGELFQCRN
jgi:Tfp pilus assembly protein PilW